MSSKLTRILNASVLATLPVISACGGTDGVPPDVIGATSDYDIDHASKTAIFEHPISEYTIALSEGAGRPIGLIVVQHPDHEELAYLNDTYIEYVEFDGVSYTQEELQSYHKLITPTTEQAVIYQAVIYSEALGSDGFTGGCAVDDTVYVHIDPEFSAFQQRMIMDQLPIQSEISPYVFKRVDEQSKATFSFSRDLEGRNTGGDCKVTLDAGYDWRNPYSQVLRKIHHEIMHALYNIGHLGFYNTDNGADYRDSRIFDIDDRYHSVMSYLEPSAEWPYKRVAALSPTILDIATIQYQVGANENTNAGDTTHTITIPRDKVANVVVLDGGGNDALDFRKVGRLRDDNGRIYHPPVLNTDMRVDLCDGATSRVNLHLEYSIAHGTKIENAITANGYDRVETCERYSIDNIIDTGFGNDRVVLNDGGHDVVDMGAGYDVVEISPAFNNLTILVFGRNLSVAEVRYGEDGEHSAVLEGVEEIVSADGVFYVP